MSTLFPTYNRLELEIAHGKGTKVTDTNGKTYLDFISGIAVCNLGHRPPSVQKAIEEQLEKVWHVSNLFPVSLQEEVGEQLVAHSCCDAAFFCNSGAEANEAAIKLARKYTGRTKVITFKQSFHGRTFATMSATGQGKIQEGFGPLLQEFVYLPYNDSEALASEINENVAAVMLEVVQGEGGVHAANAEFLKNVQKLCKENGSLFIVDEVQTGIGRTGKPFAYQHYDIEPDVITIAKGLGNGFPVGAMLGKGFLRDTFSAGSHGTTFGGNPLAMAAAKAVLAEIFDESFLIEVNKKVDYFTGKLAEKLQHIEEICEVRGKGFLIGIETSVNQGELLTKLRESGLLALPAGPQVLRLLPPLTVTKEELDEAIEKLEKVFTEMTTTVIQ
ncbi:acetylornithine transaminase [Priestia endophytica]|uniref:acetylornithine transaminase n=1 Tax=Priestia endophytica TaxID=135735 RepID=UPI002DDD8264|nr:acetylornithine transaminase [Priestia endophytica]